MCNFFTISKSPAFAYFVVTLAVVVLLTSSGLTTALPVTNIAKMKSKTPRRIFTYLKAQSENDEQPVILEQISEVERGKLFKADASNYGIYAILAQQHLALGNLEDAQRMAIEAIETARKTKQCNNIYEAYAEGILGEILYRENRFNESALHSSRALKVYEHHYRTSTVHSMI